MSLRQDWQRPLSGLTKDTGTDSGLVAFDSVPENSRILDFGTSEEAQCVLELVLNFACWLLHRCPSDWRQYSSRLIVNLVVYLCAKFGALNPRINEIRYCEIVLHPPPEVLSPRFSLPPILSLSDLAPMFPRVSGTIMDNSLHVSSQLYASRPREIKRPQDHTFRRKLSLNILSHWSCFCQLSTLGL